MSEEKFLITQPRQIKAGGWMCAVLKEDKQTILYEVLDVSPRWAFASCAFWIMDYNEQKKIAEASSKERR